MLGFPQHLYLISELPYLALAAMQKAAGLVHQWNAENSFQTSAQFILSLGNIVQRFRVRHGLSCVFGPVWPVRAGCYSQAALPMPLSKPL